MTPRIQNWMLSLLVLLAGLAGTYFLQRATIGAAHQIQKDSFNAQANEAMLRIEQRLAAYEQVLRGTKGLFAASKAVEREEFRDYVAALGLAEHYPGIQGVGFSLIIPPQEMDWHTRAIRKEGFVDYAVYPQGKRDLYTSIIYLEPFTDRNLRAFSYDMYSEPVRREAMERARDSGKAAMSGKVRLVQETKGNVQAGFLMYLPVYRNDRPHETQMERRANIIGWVYSPFRMNDLMEGVLGKSVSNIDLEIYDGQDEAPETLMYDSQSGQKHHESPQFAVSKCMEVAGHNWHIRLHSLPVFDAGIDTGRATVIRVTGILLSALLSLLVWLLASGRARALNLAEKMTHELRESEAVSRSIIEAIPVPLALNDELGNITYLNRAFMQTVGYTLEEIPTLEDWWPLAYPDAQYRQWVVEGWRKNMEQARRSNEPFVPMELEIKCKDGLARTFMVGAASIKENFVGTHLVILYDITDRIQSEKALNEKTQLLDSIVENIPNMIFLKRATDLRFELFNRAGEALVGHSRGELLGRNDYDFFPKEQADFFTAKDRATLGQDGVVDIPEEIIETPLGTRVLHTKKLALKDVLGNPTHLLGISEDITERKRTVEKLRTLSTAIEQSPLSVVITDLEARIQYVNPHFIKTTGYSREEAIGQNPRILQSGLTPKSTYDELWKRLTSGQIWRGEIVNKRKNGEFYWEEVHIAPVKDETGKPVLYVAVKLEITQRKKAEEMLSRSEAMLHTLYDSTSDAVLLLDERGIFDCNHAAMDMFGYAAKEDLLFKFPAELSSKEQPREAGSSMQIEQLIAEAMKNGSGIFEWTFQSADASRVFPADVLLNSMVLDGKTILQATIRDITERKKYEEELKRSNIELEHFGYAVSHDMRQPLRMITSYLQLIEMELGDRLDAEKRSYFEFAIDGAKRIDQMLVALLEYSRVGRGGAPPAWVDSRAILDEALLYLQPAIAEAHVKVEVSGEWPRIFVIKDEILRLVQNLVGNAVKFRVAGRTPKIAVISGARGGEWRLCIADNGVGILPGQAGRLFRIFQRLQPREAYEGNGVGLALCRKIVERHNGHIWVESEGEGLGSKFCLTLPVLHDSHIVQ